MILSLKYYSCLYLLVKIFVCVLEVLTGIGEGGDVGILGILEQLLVGALVGGDDTIAIVDGQLT